MMEEFTYWEKQVIAYAKGHFGFVEFTYDYLKYFASSMYDLPYEEVRKYNVNHMLFKLHRKMNFNDDLETMIEKMFNLKDSQSISYDEVIYVLLSDIQGAKTMGLLNGFTTESEVYSNLWKERRSK